MTIVSLPLTVQLLNGTVADAGQVMTNLNQIASNINANGAANGVNSDITQLTALVAISSDVIFSGLITLTNATLVTPTISGGTLSSTVTGVTQPVGTNTTQLATMAALIAQAFATALPSQTGNSGKFVTTNGSTASWQPAVPDFLLMAQGII